MRNVEKLGTKSKKERKKKEKKKKKVICCQTRGYIVTGAVHKSFIHREES